MEDPIDCAGADTALPPEPFLSIEGLFLMPAHLGRCRSAAVALKDLPQLEQGTRDGSGADGTVGRLRTSTPPATAALYSRAARIASRS
jgi:hypothetical protein